MASNGTYFIPPPSERLCRNGRKVITGQTNGFQSFRMRVILYKIGRLSTVLEVKYLRGIGAFEVYS
jgi:hypothetical protein